MIAFRQTTNNQLHLAIFKGKWSKDDEVLIKFILHVSQEIFLVAVDVIVGHNYISH